MSLPGPEFPGRDKNKRVSNNKKRARDFSGLCVLEVERSIQNCLLERLPHFSYDWDKMGLYAKISFKISLRIGDFRVQDVHFYDRFFFKLFSVF